MRPAAGANPGQGAAGDETVEDGEVGAAFGAGDGEGGGEAAGAEGDFGDDFAEDVHDL